MTPLENIIRNRIIADGPMPLADYMALCLSHPEHGYYRARPAIGAAGDFVTAPEVSQMFGEIVGAWLAHAWTLAGRPDPVNLVELGPGRGTLMADILRTFRVLPGLASAVRVHLVETSERMRDAQRMALSASGHAPHWHDSLAEVPRGAMLLVANEFFDALPIRQLVRCDGGWRERCVGLKNERLAFVAGPEEAGEEVAASLRDAPDGAIVELCPAARGIAGEIGGRLAADGGAGLIIDYGYRAPGLGDSLQALKGKQAADPLVDPGAADLTAHVDFAALAEAAQEAGAVVCGPITQGAFLTALGIGLRAERLRAAGAAGAELSLAVERLTGAGGMGSLFKVLGLAGQGLPPPPPFDSHAR